MKSCFLFTVCKSQSFYVDYLDVAFLYIHM